MKVLRNLRGHIKIIKGPYSAVQIASLSFNMDTVAQEQLGIPQWFPRMEKPN